jgi:hypothetical protein
MQSASSPRRFHFSTLLPTLSFLWPLTPPTPMWEASCNKNQEIIDIFFVFSLENLLKRNLVIPLLTGNFSSLFIYPPCSSLL